MAVLHGIVLALALLSLVCLPLVVAMLICAMDIVDRAGAGLEHRRAVRRERRTLHRLDRTLAPAQAGPPDPAASAEPPRPSIEQIAADLRRLDRQRLGVATRSTVWHIAVQRAYDDRLRWACSSLGVPEHLAELDGIDLEIERVRVEAELQAAGLALRATEADRR